jgi:hypothetical protein
MKRIQGLAAVLAVAALAGGGVAVAAASSSGSGAGTTTTTTTTNGMTTTTTTAPSPMTPHGAPGLRGFGGFGGGLELLDTATKTALSETFKAEETARKTASDAGKSPDDIRDAAIAAAKTRLDQAVSDGALTKAQAAAVLAALTKQADATAAVIDAAATALKLTPTDLAKQLASGTRLPDIAKTQGVDIADVMKAIQALNLGRGGAAGIFGFGGRGGGFGGGAGPGGFGPGKGPGGFGHRGFGPGKGHWQKGGNAPQPPTQTQPSTQSGSYSPKAPKTHI